MLDFIFNVFEQKSIKNTQKHNIILYQHLDIFDNAPIDLEGCYELYEEDRLCHINKDGVIQTYKELSLSSKADALEPDKTYENI